MHGRVAERDENSLERYADAGDLGRDVDGEDQLEDCFAPDSLDGIRKRKVITVLMSSAEAVRETPRT